MRLSRVAALAAAATTTLGVPFGLSLATNGAQAAPSFAHWSERALTVADRTGDPGWQAATRRAVDTWNSVGADVRLTWVEGGVGCQPEGTTIPVCRDTLPRGWRGAAAMYDGADGHLGGARVRFAANRVFSQAQKDNIACHEIGHALGLGHAGARGSCLTQGSTSANPDGEDADALRQSYGHAG